MQERKKQIKEMAHIIGETQAKDMCHQIHCGRGCPHYELYYEVCKDGFCAEALYNAGYRKQSDDGLILTFDGATGYFPKEFIIESIKAHMKQKEGQWEKRVFIVFDSEKVGYRCSGCNTTWDTATHYCPNCGAKMKGGAE